MASVGRGRFELSLGIIEWLVIVAGVVGMIGVLWIHHGEYRGTVRAGDEAEVLAVPSACVVDSGKPYALVHAWLDGAELIGDPSGPEPPVDDKLRARGAKLFARYCATCHGRLGAGYGTTATFLAHPPANFTTGTYELRTTEHEALPADVDLFRTITRGVHGTAMPPWVALSEEDRWALVAHLKTLSSQFSEDQAPPSIVPTPPAVTPDRISNGHAVYDRAGCVSCHGGTGRGDGPGADALHYASGAPAHPRDFRSDHFHRSDRIGDIFLTLVTGLDGTPMGSYAKVLSPDDLWDVAMFVSTLTPKAKDLPNGLRCPLTPIEPNADELVGIRTLVRELK